VRLKPANAGRFIFFHAYIAEIVVTIIQASPDSHWLDMPIK